MYFSEIAVNATIFNMILKDYKISYIKKNLARSHTGKIII